MSIAKKFQSQDFQSKVSCYGCEACVQVCGKDAIKMIEDEDGFRYPQVDIDRCVECGLCEKVCPYDNPTSKHQEEQVVYGGSIKDKEIRKKSTSGGAFSAIVNLWCDENYVIFGATSKGLDVYHTYITNIADLDLFRRSKYSQSHIGTAYKDAKRFLQEGKKVLFSGTPCQISALRNYLKDNEYNGQLLTLEVVCEGAPSPLYIRKYAESIRHKYNSKIKDIDYRYKDTDRWDFEVMTTTLEDNQVIKRDRWFNPFWSVWLQHLMSRPACYECPFASQHRVADITMGDLWGVHIYCPELYAKNTGCSFVVFNTEKSQKLFSKIDSQMEGHILDMTTALKYQGPLRGHISMNPQRELFMHDLHTLDFKQINKKWAKKPTLKLLYQKYVRGNRQKVAWWNFKKNILKIIK